jgi:CheY-like chemotaxis protein
MNDLKAVGQFTALIVDDISTNRQILSMIISKMGHTVFQAADGLEALKLFDQHQPDIILIDVSMPGMTGYEVVREMRSRVADWFPIIFISANSSNQNVVEGLTSGADDYLFKPFSKLVLQTKVEGLLVRKALSQLNIQKNVQLQRYKETIEDEHQAAQHLIRQFGGSDTIDDPLVKHYLHAAEYFSGDLIAAARTPDNRLHIMLADSAGHGLTAALAVIPLTHPFHEMTAKGFDISAIITEMNRRVGLYIQLPRFVATILLSLDMSQRTIQVWNGGCPPVLFIGAQDASIRHCFISKRLPLGVLAAHEFDNTTESLHYGSEPGRLLLCSDGVSEIRDASGLPHKLSGLLTKVSDAEPDQLFEALLQIMANLIGDSPPADDAALLFVNCPLAETDAFTVTKPVMNEIIFNPKDCIANSSLVVNWHFAVTLHAYQLKRMDIIQFLLGVTCQFEEGKSDSKLYLVLAELFNNALDHGLLKLDSAMKDSEEGMDAYFNQRKDRLNQLAAGEIEIQISNLTYEKCLSCTTPCRTHILKIYVRDSGEGFDYAKVTALGPQTNEGFHGRGIQLLQKCCTLVRYFGNGSEVIVYFDTSREANS